MTQPWSLMWPWLPCVEGEKRESERNGEKYLVTFWSPWVRLYQKTHNLKVSKL